MSVTDKARSQRCSEPNNDPNHCVRRAKSQTLACPITNPSKQPLKIKSFSQSFSILSVNPWAPKCTFHSSASMSCSQHLPQPTKFPLFTFLSSTQSFKAQLTTYLLLQAGQPRPDSHRTLQWLCLTTHQPQKLSHLAIADLCWCVSSLQTAAKGGNLPLPLSVHFPGVELSLGPRKAHVYQQPGID